MTIRLYYTDPLLRVFDATVVSFHVVNGRAEVVLDQTVFYPTSGGQPFDVGRLGDARVLDVFDRDDDEIVHVTDSVLERGQRVAGEIDWPRRFDHMQQHTGQHILSAAFDRSSGARTVSFHLGAETSTIDLARDTSADEIAAAEQEANRIVFEDRPVTVRFASDEEAAQLPLRKESQRKGLLRLVEVTDFDLSACGGTHVPRTGMIGVIAVAGWERFKGGTRVSFVCGSRALRAHGALRDIVSHATRLLSVGAAELPAAIERGQAESKELTKRLRSLESEVAVHRAAELLAGAETIAGRRLVLASVPGDAATIKALAAAMTGPDTPGVVAVVVGHGQPAPVAIARSSDVGLDAGAWMKDATQRFGGRGGGRPEQAQGGLAAAPDTILAHARQSLSELLEAGRA